MQFKNKAHKNSEGPAAAAPGGTVTSCLRCGTCCEKGGPSFHQADRILIEKGLIASKYLFTLRQGELAYDNVRGRLMPTDTDIIKIKAKNGRRACMFFDEKTKDCTIYNERPRECRVLKCWDTREIEAIYARDRLTRKDLMSAVEGLWDLIADHQARCDYGTIQNLVKRLNGRGKETARRKLVEIILYDTEIRSLVVSNGGLDPEMLDFLFGRPLIKTLANYGLGVRKEGRGIRIVPAAKTLKPRRAHPR